MPDNASGFCGYTTWRWQFRRCSIPVSVGSPESTSTPITETVCRRAFYDDPRMSVSIHESPPSLFPGAGFRAEAGREAAQGTAVNIGTTGRRGRTALVRSPTQVPTHKE